MELFEEVSDKQYSWKLFYTLNRIPVQEEYDKCVEESIDGITLRKILSTGFGLNIAQEEIILNKCKHLQVYTKEIELALLAGDKEMYLYQSARDDEPCEINSLNIVGKYIYVSENEVCSPIPISNTETYTNTLFRNFKEYILSGHTCVKDSVGEEYDIVYKDSDKSFTVKYSKDSQPLFEIIGADKHITYPFVYYILFKLSEVEQTTNLGYEKDFKVMKVRRKG